MKILEIVRQMAVRLFKGDFGNRQQVCRFAGHQHRFAFQDQLFAQSTPGCRMPAGEPDVHPEAGARWPGAGSRYQPYCPFDTLSNDSRTSSCSTPLSTSSSFLMYRHDFPVV